MGAMMRRMTAPWALVQGPCTLRRAGEAAARVLMPWRSRTATWVGATLTTCSALSATLSEYPSMACCSVFSLSKKHHCAAFYRRGACNLLDASNSVCGEISARSSEDRLNTQGSWVPTCTVRATGELHATSRDLHAASGAPRPA